MTTERRFVLCGHRGNMADAPENTLSSFASAERAGVDEIELDIKMTRDGVLVVIHDRTVARTAATSTPHLHTPVEELTFDELRSVDLGSGERVPTFEEVLDATTVLLQVEIKDPAAARPLAEMLLNRPEHDQARCLVTSFDPLSLADYTDVWADSPRGTALHVPDLDSNWREHAKRLRVSTILISLAILERPLVDELHDAGYIVGASLIVGPGQVRKILELNVDTSASDTPEYARRMLVESEEFTSRFPSFALNDAALAPGAA
ncbi:glycerophosphodiester phosphodiesterase [Arthrobacter sp. 2RAF6]|uniref:glycerophosphodiester phosphodiesterase n=1 Tax=Arthrobacter sp. 2RAF6 TaxID=3233002 RepID=UPI003F8D9CB0